MPATANSKSIAAVRRNVTPLTDLSERDLPETSAVTRSPASNAAAGSEGKMYPGSFDPENEKNTIGTNNQASANTRHLLAASSLDQFHFLASIKASIRNGVQGKANISMMGR